MEENNNVQIPPKSKRKFVIIGIVIAALLLIAGSSFAAYHYIKKPQKQKVACTQEIRVCPDGSNVGRTGPNCSFAPCPTTTPDPTASWKTYTNTQYGFEFKYPQRLVINPNFPTGNLLPGLGIVESQITIADPTTYHQDASLYSKDIDTGVRYDGMQIIISDTEGENYNNVFIDSLRTMTFGASNREFITKTPNNIKVNNITWAYIHGTGNFPINYFIYYLDNKKALIINKMENKNISFDSEFNQILSTFKFINNQTIIPSPTSSQKISCQTASDCPSGDMCTVWGPVRIDGPQNKYCTAPGQAVPL
jgi:hypothetical protein